MNSVQQNFHYGVDTGADVFQEKSTRSGGAAAKTGSTSIKETT